MAANVPVDEIDHQSTPPAHALPTTPVLELMASPNLVSGDRTRPALITEVNHSPIKVRSVDLSFSSSDSTHSDRNECGGKDMVDHYCPYFFDLPAEIREMVYENLLRDDWHGIKINHELCKLDRGSHVLTGVTVFHAPAAPALLRVNHQLSYEYIDLVNRRMFVPLYAFAMSEKDIEQLKSLSNYVEVSPSFWQDVRSAEIHILHARYELDTHAYLPSGISWSQHELYSYFLRHLPALKSAELGLRYHADLDHGEPGEYALRQAVTSFYSCNKDWETGVLSPFTSIYLCFKVALPACIPNFGYVANTEEDNLVDDLVEDYQNELVFNVFTSSHPGAYLGYDFVLDCEPDLPWDELWEKTAQRLWGSSADCKYHYLQYRAASVSDTTNRLIEELD